MRKTQNIDYPVWSKDDLRMEEIAVISSTDQRK
jgi:hypothetical protein